MGNSALVARTPGHTALAEAGQRLRMIEIRDRIFESGVLDLAIGMAQTGRDLRIDPVSMEIVGNEMLDPKIRQGYITMLAHKLISNAQIPKEIAPEDSHAKWANIISAELDNETEDDS